ncbi:phage tail protein [Achromobacter insuavis]|uniref:phage tail protein n=3 Tax=Achromobacter insuavis TaxID=1287735 RepID=UPI00359F8A7E
MDLLIAPYTVTKEQADTAPATGTPGWATDGNPATNKPATQWPAYAFNGMQEELVSVILGGGQTLNRSDNTLLLKAIQKLITTAVGNRPPIFSITALPTQDIGPIIVTECEEVWRWSASAYFNGYRSSLCGRPLDGHTATPLVSEVDAIGGLLSKADYARLWGYAQEQGLVKTEAIWQANRGAHWFSDFSATQFRVPDLRDMFRRFTGTDADTANARALGSRQARAIEKHRHYASDTNIWGAVSPASGGAVAIYSLGSQSGFQTGDGTAQGLKSETRPDNAAFHPRIHA